MSKENLDQFIQKVTDSEELQARIGEEIDIDSLIALGAEHGLEFSVEDLAENVELSDEELDGVAGGLVDLETSSQRISSGIDAGDSYQETLASIRGEIKGRDGYVLLSDIVRDELKGLDSY
jgi:predicted ribosomally synthesized peptide with nif11-like leader